MPGESASRQELTLDLYALCKTRATTLAGQFQAVGTGKYGCMMNGALGARRRTRGRIVEVGDVARVCRHQRTDHPGSAAAAAQIDSG